MENTNEIPRRNRLDLLSPEEISIQEAINEVELLGANPLLTKVVTLLGQAKNTLSDYVDGVDSFVNPEPTFGMNRVQASFNPSNNPRVDEIKTASAALIDLCESMRLDENCSSEKHRSIALAQTAYEEAAMHAVKANFK